MNIKAIFPAGVDALTVHGLHQWDYGQKLEITHPDLPAILEVHFAPVDGQDAIVRAVESGVGVAEVSIPDTLLEQPRPVLAWVYIVGETSGTTMLTVTMPIQARARPAAAGAIPEEIRDKYTEALGAIESLIGPLRTGAAEVGRAKEATHAATADTANQAATATKAAQDAKGRAIDTGYGYFAGDYTHGFKLPTTGLYHVFVKYKMDGSPLGRVDFGLVLYDGIQVLQSGSGVSVGGRFAPMLLTVDLDGTLTMESADVEHGMVMAGLLLYEFYYKRLWAKT